MTQKSDNSEKVPSLLRINDQDGVHDPINISGDQAVVISVGPEVIRTICVHCITGLKCTKTKPYNVCCKYL